MKKNDKIEYFCPSCGAVFNTQVGFSTDLPTYRCKVCGNISGGPKLMFPDVIWFCDKCNGLLNNQKGFNPKKKKFKCTFCGYNNNITEDNIVAYNPEEKNNNDVDLSPEIEPYAMAELEKLIGLDTVKQQIKRMRAILVKTGKTDDMNLHMCFYGNPGTGKTVVARLVARILYECGILPTDKLIETDRSGLCGQYVGETGLKTHSVVQEAMGGVLFIDEAYTLSNSNMSGSDYGSEAIAALLKDMEDYKGKFCVILAGYKNEMQEMISTNPGFDSRINRKIEFPDYSIEEMGQIFLMFMRKQKYSIETKAFNELANVFSYYLYRNDFANARTVKNIFDQLIEIQAVRTLEDADPSNDDEKIIRLTDVHTFISENCI